MKDNQQHYYCESKNVKMILSFMTPAASNLFKFLSTDTWVDVDAVGLGAVNYHNITDKKIRDSEAAVFYYTYDASLTQGRRK